jgi:hypothetical protein
MPKERPQISCLTYGVHPTRNKLGTERIVERLLVRRSSSM